MYSSAVYTMCIQTQKNMGVLKKKCNSWGVSIGSQIVYLYDYIYS